MWWHELIMWAAILPVILYAAGARLKPRAQTQLSTSSMTSRLRPRAKPSTRGSALRWPTVLRLTRARAPRNSSLLTSYSMFVFFCMLHRLDFKTSARKMAANVPLLLDERAAGVDVLKRSARFVASCESVALAAQVLLPPLSPSHTLPSGAQPLPVGAHAPSRHLFCRRRGGSTSRARSGARSGCTC